MGPPPIPIRAVWPGSWAASQGQCHHPVCGSLLHSTWHIAHSWHITYPLAYYSLTNCTDCTYVRSAFCSRTWNGWAGWLNGWLGWLALLCLDPHTSFGQGPPVSRGAVSPGEARQAQLLQHLPREIDGLESTRSTADPSTHSGLSDVSFRRTTPSRAMPSLPANHSRQRMEDAPSGTNPTLAIQQPLAQPGSQPQLIKQVPSGSQM